MRTDTLNVLVGSRYFSLHAVNVFIVVTQPVVHSTNITRTCLAASIVQQSELAALVCPHAKYNALQNTHTHTHTFRSNDRPATAMRCRIDVDQPDGGGPHRSRARLTLEWNSHRSRAETNPNRRLTSAAALVEIRAL